MSMACKEYLSEPGRQGKNRPTLAQRSSPLPTSQSSSNMVPSSRIVLCDGALVLAVVCGTAQET